MSEITPHAIAGSKKVVALLISAASRGERYFVAGPVWNSSDRRIDGPVQSLRFSFRGSKPAEIFFATEQLDKYGAGDEATAEKVAVEIRALLA